MKSRFHICLLMPILVLFINSCHRSEILVPEPVKDIAGEWRIVKAVRNGVDITTLTDFTKFRIRFTTDLQYTIENPLPFIVSKNGSYALDDPKYPFRISFSQTGISSPVSTTFTYPVVNGKRNINFTFSPGCAANTYDYTLERLNP
ncbi:DUF5004 domain-containing protein [Chitinophaga ginsengisegetis]|uniref:DUF5004 domain-containing protein n=1 Tax=Chitinophaga ginsengisegetis TaxID=393003 RepID=UPI0014551427|nr:DUF5004 domain-containing protein [Chitinophaga ginsengisegetis]MDR6571294.1 hypothetical protein [Chitinophaga ginsengisegetis]MDR6657378.1 hypothetical protein [Chitinophaga ginsengisegetis]